MVSENPLESIWQTYVVTRDCLKIAQRAIRGKHGGLLRNTEFMGDLPKDASIQIRESRRKADESAILSLWVVFERTLIVLLQEKGRKLLEVQPVSLAQPLYEKYETDVEYWRIDDSLDLLKGQVHQGLIGYVKQIKQYRDWIAHRNPRKPQPANLDPKTAYTILSEVLTYIGKIRVSTNEDIRN